MSGDSNAGCSFSLSTVSETIAEVCCFISIDGRLSSVGSVKYSSPDVLTDASLTFSGWTSLISSLPPTTASEVVVGSKNDRSGSLISAGSSGDSVVSLAKISLS